MVYFKWVRTFAHYYYLGLLDEWSRLLDLRIYGNPNLDTPAYLVELGKNVRTLNISTILSHYGLVLYYLAPRYRYAHNPIL